METKFIATILFAALLVYIVSAQPPAAAPGADKTALLDSALTDMKCKVTFETDFMNAIIEKFPSLSSSLSPHIDELQSDVSQLTQYSSQKDVMNYSMYVQVTFTPHLIDAADAQQKGLENQKGAVEDKEATKAKMRSLKSTFESLQTAQDSCFDAREHANLMINYYNNSLNMYQARTKNLSDRNIGTDYLNNLVSNARLQILDPLQSGVKSATTPSEIRELLGKYCLYDGCLNGTNFHMAVRFETTRLKTMIEIINADAEAGGMDAELGEVRSELDHASDMIDSWESMNAPGDQLETTWGDIKSAAKNLHDMYVQLGGKVEE